MSSVKYFLLYRNYKTLGTGDCGWCTGTRQYYPAVERILTSFVEERLYRKFYKFLSELPHFTLLNEMQCSQTVKSHFALRSSGQAAKWRSSRKMAVKQQKWWSKILTDSQGRDHSIYGSDKTLHFVPDMYTARCYNFAYHSMYIVKARTWNGSMKIKFGRSICDCFSLKLDFQLGR